MKKGKQSAGVARQYRGTAGRIENSQIGVFLSYSVKDELILIDRELYIPKEWFEDKQRCEQAKIPKELRFKTKPQLAKMMLHRALSHGIRPRWVVGDAVYGVSELRSYLEENNISYVLAVACNYHVSLGLSQYKVSEVMMKNWQRLSVGKGTKGERYYDWQRIKINSDSSHGWSRYLLARKSITDPQQITYYIAFCPDSASLEHMAKAAASRWTIEECFASSKGEVGLDHYEVRSYTGWYRHITLCMLALAFLAKLKHMFNQTEMKKKAPKHHMELFLKKRKLI